VETKKENVTARTTAVRTAPNARNRAYRIKRRCPQHNEPTT
jgi:hypothetical protein